VGQVVDQGVVGAMRHTGHALHTDDPDDPARLADLRGRRVGETDMAQQALDPRYQVNLVQSFSNITRAAMPR